MSHHEAQISPKIIAELKWAEAQYANGPQKIKVRWDRETNGDILLKIKNNFFTGFIKVYGYHCCGMERVNLRLGEYNLIFKKIDSVHG